MKPKLNQTQIDEIQRLVSIGIPKAKIARYYGVTKPAIEYHICTVKPLPMEDVVDLVNKHLDRAA